MARLSGIRIFGALSLILFLPLLAAGSAVDDCGSEDWDVSVDQNMCVQVITVQRTLDYSIEACIGIGEGVQLARVKNAEQNKFISEVMNKKGVLSAWIGMKRFRDMWVWNDGSVMMGDYAPWGPAEPGANDECVYLSGEEFVGQACNLLLPFVCSKPIMTSRVAFQKGAAPRICVMGAPSLVMILLLGKLIMDLAA